MHKLCCSDGITWPPDWERKQPLIEGRYGKNNGIISVTFLRGFFHPSSQLCSAGNQKVCLVLGQVLLSLALVNKSHSRKYAVA